MSPKARCACFVVMTGVGCSSGGGGDAPAERDGESTAGEPAGREPDAGSETQPDASPASDAGSAGEMPMMEPDPARPAVVHACGLDTGFPGDDKCILPPEEAQGFQLHYGPADYDDPAEVERFILGPGEEFVDCMYLNTPNEEEVFYDYFVNSFRPLTHHMIVSQLSADVSDGLSACAAGLTNNGLVGGSTVANQAIGSDTIAPENEGLGAVIAPHTQMEMQVHFFNFGTEPILREAWMNVYYKDPDEVTTLTAPLAGYAGLGRSVEAGATGVWQGTMTAPADMRIVNLYSHYHANTTRLSAWVQRAGGGDPMLVYESFDWENPGVLPLDSKHDNPAPSRADGTFGGYSGLLELKEGDRFIYECEIDNMTENPLRWGNEAFDAEMCILRGNYAPSTGSPWNEVTQ